MTEASLEALAEAWDAGCEAYPTGAENPYRVMASNETDRCVVCSASSPRHGGLCCAHRYDEQPPCDRCVISSTEDAS